MRSETCNVLMIYPRFNANSFWNYQATCDIVGARYPAAPLGLITVAALLPKAWNIRLINRNTEELTDADWEWADLIMTGGMLPQQRDTLRLIRQAKALGKPVVVGGPDVTSSPHMYAEADFQVRGEAEGIIEQFLTAWRNGERHGVYEGEKFQVDITTSPVPRFDLLKFDHYLHVGVQYSRGCPFSCEFCDIIELYGRVPRTKTNAQLLAELNELYRLGYRGHIDFVDDNLIGNKKNLKQFLPALASWLVEHDFPFEFSTEASINLADDDALLAQLQATNFFAIFVGIESPDTATLVQTQKKQNTRRSITASIERIYRAGIFVNAGFIVGFDTEQESVAAEMVRCIEAAAIPVCMVGMLYALPNTQLARRLVREGRLHPGAECAHTEDEADQCTAGLNFDLLRPRRDVLADYQSIIQSIYEPSAYFGRVRRVGRQLDCSQRRLKQPLKHLGRDALAFGRMVWRLGVKAKTVRREFWRTVVDCVLHNPRAFRYVGSLMALYLHFGPFAQYVSDRLGAKIQALDEDAWLRPASSGKATPGVPQGEFVALRLA